MSLADIKVMPLVNRQRVALRVRACIVELDRDEVSALIEALDRNVRYLDVQRQAAAVVAWLDKVQAEHNPGVIVIEQPMPAKFSKNLAATQIAIGLSMVVQSHAHRVGALFREIPIISAKAWFGSKMSKDKAPMMACARDLGWQVKTDHEADALAILDLFLARMMAARALPRRAA